MRRDKARAAVVKLMRDLALYVQHTCQGDMQKLLSSGFTAQKLKRQPVGVLLPPQNVRLRPARVTGQIIARCNKMPDAKAYQWRFATALAPTAWTMTDTVIAANTTLVGLTRGTDDIVQVRAFGTRGASDWSDAATLMAG